MSKRKRAVTALLILAAVFTIGRLAGLFGGSRWVTVQLTRQEAAALNGYHVKLSNFISNPDKAEYADAFKCDLAENAGFYGRVFGDGAAELDVEGYFEDCRKYASRLPDFLRQRVSDRVYRGTDAAWELSGMVNGDSLWPAFDKAEARVKVAGLAFSDISFLTGRKPKLTGVMMGGQWDEDFGVPLKPSGGKSGNILKGETKLVTVELDRGDAADLLFFHTGLAHYISQLEDTYRLDWIDSVKDGLDVCHRVFGTPEAGKDEWAQVRETAAAARQFISGISESEQRELYEEIDASCNYCMDELLSALDGEDGWEKVRIELEIRRDGLTDGREGYIDHVVSREPAVKSVMTGGQWTEDFEWPPEN